MKVVFLGPHFDDCILSCGELIDKYIQEGADVKAVTFFTGYPSSLEFSDAAKQFHSNCFLDERSMDYRAEEDKAAMNFLSCEYKHIGLYECLYRKDHQNHWLYPDLKNIYHMEDFDNGEIDTIVDLILTEIKCADVVYAPMGLGKHADHILLSKAAEKAAKKADVKFYFYEEIPYVCYYYKNRKKSNWGNGMKPTIIEVSENNWKRKLEAIKIYRSQLHILWKNETQRLSQLKDISYKYSLKNSLRVWEL